jgi:glycosyltransferase
MKISVVTACYNSAATIGHTVASFLAQDWPDKEMLVVDGASTDRTIEIVRRHSRRLRARPGRL